MMLYFNVLVAKIVTKKFLHPIILVLSTSSNQ